MLVIEVPRPTQEKEYTMQVYFARNLKALLKTFIKGDVRTYLKGDDLQVHIYSVNGIVYHYTLENLSSEIVQGLSSETLAHRILKWYKGYINNLFFL